MINSMTQPGVNHSSWIGTPIFDGWHFFFVIHLDVHRDKARSCFEKIPLEVDKVISGVILAIRGCIGHGREVSFTREMST